MGGMLCFGFLVADPLRYVGFGIVPPGLLTAWNIAVMSYLSKL